MKAVLIVAGHELHTAIRTRSFWVQILLVPFFALVGSVVVRLTSLPEVPTAYVIVDQSRGIAAPLIEAMERPAPMFGPRPVGPAPVRVPAIPALDDVADSAAMMDALKPYFAGDVKVLANNAPVTLSAAIVIPPRFGTSFGGPAEILSLRALPDAFVQQVRTALSQVLRTRALEAQGIDPAVVARAQRINAFVKVEDTAGTQNRPNFQAQMTSRIASLVFGVLLLGSIFASGQRLLAGVVEERSNKLVETILSSVTSDQFMAGKLVGIAVLGVAIIFAWTVSAIVMLKSGDSQAFTMIAASLDAKTIAVFALYFVAAYIMYGAIFLGVGSTVDSAQDAQSYMVPMATLTMLPLILGTSPTGTMPIVLSWIPLYTPLMVMLRVPFHPPLWQIIGPTIVMIAFIVLMLRMMSRVFRASILASGATLRGAQLWAVLTGKSG